MPSPEFDVFLSHNSRDKAHIRELSKLLKQRRVKVWLDEEELVPGEPWQKGLEQGLLASATIAVCIGQHEMGRWHEPEMRVALDLATKKAVRILPILLPGAAETPELALFLQQYNWVDLREGFAADLIDRVVWGITGKKPAPSLAPRLEGANPFGQVGPIRDAARFVGREAELRRLKEMLRHGSAVIVGGSKVGKTSLMWRVAEGWQGEVVGPFNFQGYLSEEDFLEQLAAEVKAPQADWRALREHLSSRHVLILLDELDAAQEAGVSIGLFVRLRAVLNANPGCTVLASSHLTPQELYPGVNAAGSPAFGLIQPLQLGDLKPAEADLLLEHPWAPEVPRFERDVKELLLNHAGLHPYRLQQAAYHYFEAGRDDGYDWLHHWRLSLGSLQ